MFVIVILGFVIIMIAFGFFMEKKFGTGTPNKSDNQTLNEEIGRNTTNPTNSNNINGPN
ncbi:hypothetical protein ABWK22_20165 [Gottfriedia acidiceleris]|uniref:hypothetical protein n=1 Tax=Bacillaceae TaxID=186817 RepID=UPI001596E309|nr:hypothetical protein [Bacillus sp. AFS001701]